MIVKTNLRRIHPIRAYPVLIIGLLMLALGSISYGLSDLVRGMDFGQLMLISMTALVLSWQLARSKSPEWAAVLVLTACGALLTVLWVGELWALLNSLLRKGAALVWQINLGNLSLPGDRSAFLAILDQMKLRSTTLWVEMSLWLRSLAAGQPIYQPLAVALLWGFSIWLVSAWAGWFQRRRERPFTAILPAGLLLALGLGYTYGATRALFPLIFAILPLWALTFYDQLERSWIARDMDYPEEERSEKLALIFGITICFVFAAAIIPRVSIQPVIETVQGWLKPGMETVDPLFESFGFEAGLTPMDGLEKALKGGLPQKDLIGTGPELSDQIVMSIQLEASAFEELKNLAVPLYWRSSTYDYYTGFGWKSSDVMVRSYEADETAFMVGDDDGHDAYKIVGQEIRTVEADDLIFAAGEIVTLDSSYQIAWRTVPERTESQATQGDPFVGSVRKNSYRVDSAIPVVSEGELEASEGMYPAWVRERYLALPENVSRRVIELAQELTRDAPTAYRKAAAIESFLRTFEYELDLPAPPKNRELADYFLFELQKGYCDYYATSMVMLARAVGIPARLASGYSQGRRDADNSQFIIAEDNAHSWVELYFSGYGWIPFEPTAAQPEIQRASGGVDVPIELHPPTGLSSLSNNLDWLPDRWFYWPGAILLGCGIVLLMWPLLDRWYLKSMPPSKMIARLYKRLYSLGIRVGSPAQLGDTPLEFSVGLENQIQEISEYSRWGNYLQPAADDLQALTNTYMRSIYSSELLSKEEVGSMIASWQRLRSRFFLARGLYLWQTKVRR